MSNKLGHIVFTLIILASASSCGSPPVLTPDPRNFVVIPASDSTPPNVGMTVTDNGKMWYDVYDTSRPIAFQTGSDTVTVIADAKDNDGGIKAVKLWATYTYYKPGQTVGPGLAGTPVQQVVNDAHVGESALKDRFFLYNFDLKKELGGWSTIKIDVWTEGENFHGGNLSTPMVSIIYPPPRPTPNKHYCGTPAAGPPPTITLPKAFIEGSQKPGRLMESIQLWNQLDVLLIIVDDAPGLTKDQMKVELDIDPKGMYKDGNGVKRNKAIEAWSFCHLSRVNVIEAAMVVGAACHDLSDANDSRSGCTNTQTMLLDRSTTDEIWLRKPVGPIPVWIDVEGIDSSIWQAWGGRSVRFIWRFETP